MARTCLIIGKQIKDDEVIEQSGAGIYGAPTLNAGVTLTGERPGRSVRPFGTAKVIGQFRVDGWNGYFVEDKRRGAVTKMTEVRSGS
jgi:hypothetical protein